MDYTTAANCVRHAVERYGRTEAQTRPVICGGRQGVSLVRLTMPKIRRVNLEPRGMNILFIGDIFGSPGRRIVADHLRDIVETNRIDLAIANAENSAGGFG